MKGATLKATLFVLDLCIVFTYKYSRDQRLEWNHGHSNVANKKNLPFAQEKHSGDFGVMKPNLQNKQGPLAHYKLLFSKRRQKYGPGTQLA